MMAAKKASELLLQSLRLLLWPESNGLFEEAAADVTQPHSSTQIRQNPSPLILAWPQSGHCYSWNAYEH